MTLISRVLTLVNSIGADVKSINTSLATKRSLIPRVVSTTSTATLTINADTTDSSHLTAQAVPLTIANPTGTPVASQKILIRIKDDGTARAITWGTEFRAIGVTLPTTTVVGKILYVGVVRNATDSKWDVIAVAQEA
jgi:hypothetical protein